LKDLLGIEPPDAIDTFCVLKGIEGTADGELRNDHCCIQFETKIVSGSLREDQICLHLRRLQESGLPVQKLVLLTPDDSGSRYVQRFVAIDSQRIVHLAWTRLYGFLRSRAADLTDVFEQLVRQFLEFVHDQVFEQDLCGIVLKVDFGSKSEIFEDTYLAKLRAEEWTYWNTPREYKALDGRGRKLMFYDRTRKGITAEVEIAKVSRTDEEEDYPWANIFAPGTIRVFEQPIPLEQIRQVQGLEDFGRHKKDRNAFRKLTHEQYRQLKGDVEPR